MGDKQAIGHLHDLLQHTDRWYIEVESPDIPELEEISEKAKESADSALSSMSTFALYQRYKRWRASEPFIGKGEDYFNAFLNQVVFDLGKNSLKGKERMLFEDSCNLSLKFI